VSPIVLLVRSAAASDPDLAALLEASNTDREQRARHHARFLKARLPARGRHPGPGRRRPLDLHVPELYDLLVVQRGWSLPEFARFLADFLIGALLPAATDPP
jgi:hypothetical protein